MGALEKLVQYKKEGKTENEAISLLKEEGFNPGAIMEALTQIRIKETVGKENMDNKEEMQPSIMESSPEEYQNQGYQEENRNQQKGYFPPENSAEYYSPQQPFQGQNYSEDQYYEEAYSPQQTNFQDTDTLIEIAEQVFSEKIKDISNKIKEFKEFKTIYQEKIEDINERLKRMEKMFDKMQISILDKVGSFGKEITGLRKEVEMVEDSFSKMHSSSKKK